MLRPGKHDDTADTMAAAMESAFLSEWPHFNGTLPEPSAKQMTAMRLFFVAVAQGVVQHLRDHPDSFTLAITSSDHTHDGGAHVHGDGAHSHSGGTHAHAAAVASIQTTGTTA